MCRCCVFIWTEDELEMAYFERRDMMSSHTVEKRDLESGWPKKNLVSNFVDLISCAEFFMRLEPAARRNDAWTSQCRSVCCDWGVKALCDGESVWLVGRNASWRGGIELTPMTINYIQAQQSDGKLYDDCLFLHFLRSHKLTLLVLYLARKDCM
jgi:hypothetical protein